MASSNLNGFSVADGTENRLTVREFIESAPEELALSVLAGAEGSGERFISSERIQKLGLALAGFDSYIHQGRVQMIGQSEVAFLLGLSADARRDAVGKLPADIISCFLLTKDLDPPSELVEFAKTKRIPLIRTAEVSSKAIAVASEFLQDRLAPQLTVHGVLTEIQGLGVLMIGESGIGKSECALELISRGHRLVADDSVVIKRLGRRLQARAPELTAEMLEIRGLGIVNIRELFGIAAVCPKIDIELCIEFVQWNGADVFERIGTEPLKYELFGQQRRKFTIPVRPGRNLGTLVETAVKLYLLERTGVDAGRSLAERHDRILLGNS